MFLLLSIGAGETNPGKPGEKGGGGGVAEKPSSLLFRPSSIEIEASTPAKQLSDSDPGSASFSSSDLLTIHVMRTAQINSNDLTAI